nr:aldo/keto reductase [Micromonospora sp. DSM 115978]
MTRVSLGDAGPRVSAIGLGCMGMSWVYVEQRKDADEAEQTVRAAVAAGVTHLDTSDLYGPFTNEELVGRALRGVSERPVVATKGGLVADPRSRLGDVQVRADGRPAHLRAACEASLRRLGVETIDLYYLHRVDPTVPVEESWGELAALRAEGKVRHLGLSEASVSQLAAA